MSDVERFTMLLARVGVGLPRGVLGPDARALARLRAAGRDDGTDRLRDAAAAEHWPHLRGAIGAALDRVPVEVGDPTLDDALVAAGDPDPANPLALALIEDAARSFAAVMVRMDERLAVLDRRLADGQTDEALTRTVGDIVVDLLDLDPQEYEDEIGDYLRAGETDSARAELARTTGDSEIRGWAREELAEAVGGRDGDAALALGHLASMPAVDDPAEDPVWTAAILALVDEAVELATVDQVLGEDDADR